MNKKQILILLGIAIIVSIIFTIIQRKEQKIQKITEEKIGNIILPQLELPKLDAIKIFSGKEIKTHLQKINEQWVVSNLFNYPAEPSKIRSFALDLSQMKSLKNIPYNPSQLDRFNLNPENNQPPTIKIELYYSNAAKFAEFYAGKTHTKKSAEEYAVDIPTGRFLYLPDKKQVLVSDKLLNEINDEPFDWVDKSFFSVQKIKSATLILEDGSTAWTLSRASENDELKLQQNIPEGKEENKSKISDISSALSYVSFANIADPNLSSEKSGLDKAKTFTAEDFAGIKYTLKIGNKENNNFYVKVSAEYVGLTPPPPAENETEEQKKKREEDFANKEKASKEKVEEINSKYAKWLYLLPEYKINTLTYSLNDLMKDIEKPSPTETPQKNQQEEESAEQKPEESTKSQDSNKQTE